MAVAQDQQKADSIRAIVENQDLGSLEEMRAYFLLSSFSSDPADELKYGQQLVELARKANNLEYLIKGHQRMGVAYRLMGELGKALEYLFQSANDAAGKPEFQELLAYTYAEISTCYTQNGDSDNALLYGAKTVAILRKTDEKQRLALTLLNVGYDYYLLNNYDSALAYYNESEPLLIEIGYQLGQAYIIGNRALVYWKTGDPQKAKRDLFTAIEMLGEYGDQYGMADYYNQLGAIYLEEGDEQSAINYTMKGLEMAKEIDLKQQIRDASYLLFLLHQRVGDYQRAINYQTQYHAYKDSIQNLETTQQLANLRTEYEVGQKQVEVDLLMQQKRNGQIIMITGAIVLVIVIGLGILIYTFLKAKTRLNEQLQLQKNELVKLNNTKDKFFSIISHDLRGPASVLSGLVGVIKYDLEEMEKHELRELIDTMESSTAKLVKLLDNLLQWAMQQTGHYQHKPENISLQILLHEVQEIFSDMAATKKIDLDLQMTNDFEVFADRNAASTIFRNLLNNALKFTPEGGKVSLQAARNGRVGIVKVMDNGVGIPEEKMKSLFTLNENISTKGTSGETGLGLGLQLVYDFLEINQGQIQVESEEGKGTTFTIQLPLAAN